MTRLSCPNSTLLLFSIFSALSFSPFFCVYFDSFEMSIVARILKGFDLISKMKVTPKVVFRNLSYDIGRQYRLRCKAMKHKFWIWLEVKVQRGPQASSVFGGWLEGTSCTVCKLTYIKAWRIQFPDVHTFSKQGASKGDPLGQGAWVGLHASRHYRQPPLSTWSGPFPSLTLALILCKRLHTAWLMSGAKFYAKAH